eukprot:c2840_g1_i1.p1 GENE.c2840_g1_i1~~c2840_g1_i1.p1  ORF type:complete len:314 (+),score=88.28 c2840_g1_i1:81-1022(+)
MDSGKVVDVQSAAHAHIRALFAQLHESLQTHEDALVTQVDDAIKQRHVELDGSTELIDGVDGWSVRVEVSKEAVANVQQLISALCSVVVVPSSNTDSAPFEEPSEAGDARNAAQQIKTILQSLKTGELSLHQATHDIRRTLHHNTSLENLNLDVGNVGDEGVRALASALRTNTSLKTLSLASNHIGNSGAEALANVLRTNASLGWLSLSGNNIGDEGARVLADALRTNASLKDLDLASNNVGDEGASTFADVLRTNTSLNWLNLSENRVGDLGGKALLHSLQANATLKTLYHASNSISSPISNAIQQALKGRH